MNVLIATDGMLPLDETVSWVERTHRPGDSIVVMTAVNLPGPLIDALGTGISSPSGDVEEVVDAAGAPLQGGDRVADRILGGSTAAGSIEVIIEDYFRRIGEECAQPMVDALAGAGIEATKLIRETDNRTAAAILQTCHDLDIELLVFGSTGRGRFQGLVGSTGTKLTRHAPCSVLMIRVDVPG